MSKDEAALEFPMQVKHVHHRNTRGIGSKSRFLMYILSLCMGWFVLCFAAGESYASHYRGGDIHYENLGRLGGTTAQKDWIVIKATLTIFQRGSAHCNQPVQSLSGAATAVPPHSTNCCNANGMPQGCLNRWRAVGGTFSWGRGGLPHPTLSSPLIPYQPKGQLADTFTATYMKVIDEDTQQDYMGFQLVLYRIYPPSTQFTTIAWGSCCWISGTLPQLSHFEIRVTAQVNSGNQSPRFNSQLLLNACSNQQFRHNINPSDPDRDNVEVELIPTVGGADRQVVPLQVSKSGILTWSKPVAGLWIVKLMAYDLNPSGTRKGASSFRDFLLRVSTACQNTPPAIVLTPASMTVKSGDKACTKVTVNDPNSIDRLTVRVNPTKQGVTLNPAQALAPNRPNPSTFTYCWTPKASDEGTTHTIQFTVSDTGSPVLSTQKEFKVTVRPGAKPTITVTPPGATKIVSEGKCTTFTAKAQDADSAIQSFTVSVPSFCSRKRLSATEFEVKCCPTFGDGGKTFDVVFTAVDRDGTPKTTSETVRIRVGNTNRTPSITSPGAQGLPENRPYRLQVKASDPDGDTLTYSMSGLPAGAKINSKTGEITWTPTSKDIGTYTVTLTVTDSQGAKASLQVTFRVTDVNDPPSITSKPPFAAFVGEETKYTAKAIDPDKNTTFTWSLISAPPGASIDAQTGEVKWTPSKNDSRQQRTFEIQVCDNGSPQQCTRQKWTMNVFLKCRVDVDCTQDDLCVEQPSTGRVCVRAGCAAQSPSCRSKQDFCKDGKCNENPCNGSNCQAGTYCRPLDGTCVKPCGGVVCQQGEHCVEGACTRNPCATAGANGGPCASNELCDTSNAQAPKCVKNPCSSKSCRHGRVCLKDRCIDDPCDQIQCPDPSKQRCVAGQCIDRKACKVDIHCDGQDVCVNQRCIPSGCYTQKPRCSGVNNQCVDALCKRDECASGVQNCSGGEFCRPIDNTCVRSCGTVSCKKGERCKKGVCQPDPCASVRCKAGEVCIEGSCQDDQCNASNVCRHGRICNSATNTCTDDPCAGVKCPARSECRGGQCLPPPDCRFDRECGGDLLCVNRKCEPPECKSSSACPKGKICSDGRCLENPCAGKTCSNGQVCIKGKCVDTCAGVFCDTFEKCIEGACTNDPCAGKRCPTGRTCVNGTCVNDLCSKENKPCKQGRLCKIDRCTEDACLGIQCPQGLVCKDGQCEGSRSCKVDSDCPNGGVCIQGTCRAPDCYVKKCTGAGRVCLKAACGENPCDTKKCKTGEVCRPADGLCVAVCPTCKEGQICTNGICGVDPCASKKCASGERCEAGKCIQDRCAAQDASSKFCRYRRVCKNNACQDDPCAFVACGKGESCRAGICVGPPLPTEKVDERSSERTLSDGGSHEAHNESSYYAAGGLGCLGCSAQKDRPFGPDGFLWLLIALCCLGAVRRKRTSNEHSTSS